MRRTLLALAIMSLCVAPAAAGDCLAVSAISQPLALTTVAVPLRTQHQHQTHFNAATGQPITVQALTVPVATYQLAVPHQAFVVQQNHHVQSQCVLRSGAAVRRAVVVQQRVRRERRGLARLLFGR